MEPKNDGCHDQNFLRHGLLFRFVMLNFGRAAIVFKVVCVCQCILTGQISVSPKPELRDFGGIPY